MTHYHNAGLIFVPQSRSLYHKTYAF